MQNSTIFGANTKSLRGPTLKPGFFASTQKIYYNALPGNRISNLTRPYTPLGGANATLVGV